MTTIRFNIFTQQNDRLRANRVIRKTPKLSILPEQDNIRLTFSADSNSGQTYNGLPSSVVHPIKNPDSFLERAGGLKKLTLEFKKSYPFYNPATQKPSNINVIVIDALKSDVHPDSGQHHSMAPTGHHQMACSNIAQWQGNIHPDDHMPVDRALHYDFIRRIERSALKKAMQEHSLNNMPPAIEKQMQQYIERSATALLDDINDQLEFIIKAKNTGLAIKIPDLTTFNYRLKKLATSNTAQEVVNEILRTEKPTSPNIKKVGTYLHDSSMSSIEKLHRLYRDLLDAPQEDFYKDLRLISASIGRQGVDVYRDILNLLYGNNKDLKPRQVKDVIDLVDKTLETGTELDRSIVEYQQVTKKLTDNNILMFIPTGNDENYFKKAWNMEQFDRQGQGFAYYGYSDDVVSVAGSDRNDGTIKKRKYQMMDKYDQHKMADFSCSSDKTARFKPTLTVTATKVLDGVSGYSGGTSLAVPGAVGVAYRVLRKNTELKPHEVVNTLTNNCHQIDGIGEEFQGAGVLDPTL